MKKKLLVIVALMMSMTMAFGLTGCGGSGGDSESSGEPIPFIIGTVETDDSITAQCLSEFEEYVEAETDGAIDVQINNNGVLGGEREILEGVELGTIQMALPGTSQFEQYDKKFAIFDTPFLFPTREIYFAAWDGDLGQQYREWLKEKGFECYGCVYLGYRGLANNKHAVTSPADMKGLKIRVMESDTYVDLFNALGANAVAMAYSEVYTALQQGTIDGQDNPPQYNIEAGFYELQPYYTELNHVMSKELYICSTEFMEGLDPAYREAIEKGLADCCVKHNEKMVEANDGYIQQMKDADIEITTLTPEQTKAFADCCAGIWDDMKAAVGDEVFELAESYSK